MLKAFADEFFQIPGTDGGKRVVFSSFLNVVSIGSMYVRQRIDDNNDI